MVDKSEGFGAHSQPGMKKHKAVKEDPGSQDDQHTLQWQSGLMQSYELTAKKLF